MLNPATDELRMLNPFSVVPTAYRVQAGGRWWYGNCAWDAFGICAALHADGRVETSCPDCGEPLTVELRDERVDDESLALPLSSSRRRTGGTTSSSPEAAMNLFRSEEHIARWLGGREPGRRSPVAKLAELAHAWWDDRISPDWVPHTREQNQAILERLGLTGAFWQLA